MFLQNVSSCNDENINFNLLLSHADVQIDVQIDRDVVFIILINLHHHFKNQLKCLCQNFTLTLIFQEIELKKIISDVSSMMGSEYCQY